MIKKFIYRAPGGADDQGGPGFSLADIDNDDIPAPKGSEDSSDDDGKDDDKGDDDPNDKKEDDKPTADELEAQRLADEEKKVKDDELAAAAAKGDKPIVEEDEVDDAEEFFKEVDELRGDQLVVEYGDVDPLSPAGIVLRDSAVADSAIEQFEAHLQEKYPKAYGYLLHTVAGKPEEDFFGKANDLETLPTTEEIEASVEVQKSEVMASLIAKGNSEKHADLILKQLIEDNELEEAAKVANTERRNSQAAEIARLQKENDDAQQVQQEAIGRMNTFVDTLVSTGKIGEIVIPEKDRAGFAKSIKDSIKLSNGKFVLTTEIDDKNAAEIFSKEYFAFKKGNLGDLVTAKAKTENVKRLRRTLPTDTPKGGADKQTKFVTMGEIDAD